MARSWRGRITIHNELTHHVTDQHYARTVHFPTHRAALMAAKLYRGYLRRYGDINLLHPPKSVSVPLHFPPHADPRFENDVRYDPDRRRRNAPRPQYASDVDTWFAQHPDEHTTWLSYPPHKDTP